MISEEFRDGHPRTTVALPGADGDLEIEFIIDTGFEGDLALPGHLARRLGQPAGFRVRALADGTLIKCPYFLVTIDWIDGESRRTEVLVLEGEPLLGTAYLRDTLVQIEMSEGGEVSAEVM
jgi:predicted aspartyl protease